MRHENKPRYRVDIGETGWHSWRQERIGLRSVSNRLLGIKMMEVHQFRVGQTAKLPNCCRWLSCSMEANSTQEECYATSVANGDGTDGGGGGRFHKCSILTRPHALHGFTEKESIPKGDWTNAVYRRQCCYLTGSCPLCTERCIQLVDWLPASLSPQISTAPNANPTSSTT